MLPPRERSQPLVHWQAHSLDVTWSPAAAIYTTRVWHEGNVAMQGNSINAHMHAPQAWLDQVRVGGDLGVSCTYVVSQGERRGRRCFC